MFALCVCFYASFLLTSQANILLGGITVFTKSDSTCCNRCYRSVVCLCPSVCHLSHSCTLLRPLDSVKCCVAETRVVPINVALDRNLGPPRRGLGVRTPRSQWCCLLPYYFGPCFSSFILLMQSWSADWLYPSVVCSLLLRNTNCMCYNTWLWVEVNCC